MKVLEGKSVFSGIAIGKISILQKVDASVKRVHVEDPEEEVKRVEAAREQAEMCIRDRIANGQNKLEKRDVILGQYDEDLGEYEIADGLSEKDKIAFPTDELKEGMSVTEGTACLLYKSIFRLCSGKYSLSS